MTTLSQHAGLRSARAAGLSSASSTSSLTARLRSWSQPLRQALLVGSAALLVACGGGGGGGAAVPPDGGVITPPDVAAPGAPATPAGLSLGAAGIKTLNFQWTAVDGATHYQLLEDLDGTGTASSPVAISTSIAATQYGHEVPLYERLNATYTLRACNALGCSASSAAFKPSIANLNAAIGYAKATGGGVTEDQYGTAIALSRDGNTLAVGAPGEDTGAFDSGAVFVMRRSAAGQWTTLPMLKDAVINTGEAFGQSVALSADGSVLAVGVPRNTATAVMGGSVRLFVFDLPTQQYAAADALTANVVGDGDRFGAAVALSDDGNVLAVGAPQEDSAIGMGGLLQPGDTSAPDAGAVYVYRRSGGVNQWTNEQFMKASNAGSEDRFGSSIALSGDGLTLAVGAHLEDSGSSDISATPAGFGLPLNNAANAGAVYVFRRAAVDAIFGNQVYIKASNTDAGDRFGTSVALSQDGATLAVGADREASATGDDESDNSFDSAGAAYIFVRNNATGAWTQQAYIKASNASEGSDFGAAVALSSDGNTLAVGADSDYRIGIGLGAEPLATSDEYVRGAVYVFKRSAGVWSQSAYVKSPSQTTSSVSFGSSLALSGDGGLLAVGNPEENHGAPAAQYPIAGAPETDNEAAEDSGAVYIF